NIISSSPEFILPSVVSYPLIVSVGDSIEIPIRFRPTGFGAKSATITITSNDPSGPQTVAVSGVAMTPGLALIIAAAGNFGNACVGSFVDQSLRLNNSGRCTLSISNITSSSVEFVVPHVASYPLTIGAGDFLEIPIRFQPVSFGQKSATLTVASDDPA